MFSVLGVSWQPLLSGPALPWLSFEELGTASYRSTFISGADWTVVASLWLHSMLSFTRPFQTLVLPSSWLHSPTS